MPRLVVPRAERRLGSGPNTRSAGDDYRDRLVKYIPAESVAFYAFTDKLLSSQLVPGAPGATPHFATGALYVMSVALLLLGLIGTPIYLYRQRGTEPWKLHTAISTIAFLLWAYTLGGTLFLTQGWYTAFLAGFMAPIFTFVAGFFEPKPTTAT